MRSLKRVRAALTTAALGAVLPLVSCVSLEPIRSRDPSRITGRAVQKAAASRDERVRTGLEDLLATRLAGTSAISPDLAAEAVVSLGKIGRVESFPILARVAREDGDEEVRYLAVESATLVDAARAHEVCAAAAAGDPSDLVRDRARAELRHKEPGK